MRDNLEHCAGPPLFRFVDQDVTAALDEAALGGPPDFVFHLASPASPPDYCKHALETLPARIAALEAEAFIVWPNQWLALRRARHSQVPEIDTAGALTQR